MKVAFEALTENQLSPKQTKNKIKKLSENIEFFKNIKTKIENFNFLKTYSLNEYEKILEFNKSNKNNIKNITFLRDNNIEIKEDSDLHKIKKFKEKLNQFQKKKSFLSNDIDLVKIKNRYTIKELNEQINVVRESGIMSFFSSELKKAKAIFKELGLNLEDKTTAVRNLQEIVDLLRTQNG